MLCYVMVCYNMLCYVESYHVVLGMLCYVMLCYVVLCGVVLCGVVLGCAMVCVVLMNVMLYCVMLCCVVLFCFFSSISCIYRYSTSMFTVRLKHVSVPFKWVSNLLTICKFQRFYLDVLLWTRNCLRWNVYKTTTDLNHQTAINLHKPAQEKINK